MSLYVTFLATTMTAAQEVAARDRTSDLLIRMQTSNPLCHPAPQGIVCPSGLKRQHSFPCFAACIIDLDKHNIIDLDCWLRFGFKSPLRQYLKAIFLIILFKVVVREGERMTERKKKKCYSMTFFVTCCVFSGHVPHSIFPAWPISWRLFFLHLPLDDGQR